MGAASVLAIVLCATPSSAGPQGGSGSPDPVFVQVFGADDVDLEPEELNIVVSRLGAPYGVDPRFRNTTGVVKVTPEGGRPHQVARFGYEYDTGGGSEASVDPCSMGGRDLPDARFTVTVELDSDPPYRYSKELRLGPDTTKPTVKKIQSAPAPESKVEPGDTIRFEVVGKEDSPGATWQTGVQNLQITGPQGKIEDTNAGRTPKACDEKSKSLTIEDKYKVRKKDPAIIEICGIAEDYAANEGSTCAQYYKGEVWEGPFRQSVRGCTGADKWTLTVVVTEDDEVTASGTLTSPGLLCPNSALAPEGLTLQVSGTRDQDGFHLTVTPCACPPLDLPVDGNVAKATVQDPTGTSSYAVALKCKSCED